MPTCFVYCRKSSEAEDRQILSIDSQISELKRFAAKKGLRIVSVLTEAKSAKAPGRPVFNSMMERLYRGEADGILCWKLDRLARNPVDGGAVIWAMKEHDVKIITPFQAYGQYEDNILLMYMEFGMAQKYIDDLSKTVKRGLRAKAESGWYPTLVPPGYINMENEEGRNVVGKDPKRFDLIRRCWELVMTGKHSLAEIRDIANTAWGYKTGLGNPMSRGTIYTIFSNPFYHGIYEYPKGSDIWHTGRHTPMVTEAEFEAVQQLLARSKKMPRNRNRFPFSGLIRCGQCDSAVTADERHQLICSECGHKFAYRSKQHCPRCQIPIGEMENPLRLHYTYYHCTKSQNPDCEEHYMRREEVERQIIQLLETVGLPQPYGLWLNRLHARVSGNRGGEDALSAIRQLFPGAALEVQRQIVLSIFSTITLKDGKLLATLKAPFEFLAQGEVSREFDQNPFTAQALQEQKA